MKKIEALTPAQEAQMISVREEWLAIGRNTDQIDQEKAKAAITAMYQAIGKDAPKFMIFQSPWQAAAAISIIKTFMKDDGLKTNLGANLGANLRATLRDNLRATLRATLRDNLRDNLGANLRANLGANLGDNLGANLWANLGANLGANLRDNLGANLWANLRDNLGANLRDNLGANLRANLRDNLGDNLGDNLDFNYYGGQHWCAWEVFYDFCNKIGVPYSQKDRALLDLWLEQSKSCHWWWPYDGMCVLTERHTVLTVDDRGRLHNETGPACAYSDGYAIYSWHGVMVNREIIEEPITVAMIESEQNAEVRRVMMERYGYEKYILDCDAKLVDSCPLDYPIIGLRDAKLRIKQVNDDEPIVYVDLLNSTPEPDGSVKRYLMRVDPNTYNGDASRYCQAAAASTWRDSIDGSLAIKNWKDYQPVFES